MTGTHRWKSLLGNYQLLYCEPRAELNPPFDAARADTPGAKHIRYRENRYARACLALVLLAVVQPGIGCREKAPSFDILTLEGKVEKVDVGPNGTGKITVVYFSEKRNQDIVGTASVNRNNEIMINGAVATLEAVRVGEHVRGEVRIEKKGKDKIQTALKIYIDRAQPE